MRLAERTEQQSAVRRRPRPACALRHGDFGKLLQGAGLGVAEGEANAESARAVFERMQPDRLRARLWRRGQRGRATRRQQIGGTRLYSYGGDGRKQSQHGIDRVLRRDDADFRRCRCVAGERHMKSWTFARLGGLQPNIGGKRVETDAPAAVNHHGDFRRERKSGVGDGLSKRRGDRLRIDQSG